MRVPKDLALMIARAGISNEYRQIKCMNTKEFASWLSERQVQFGWRRIHHLWSIGLLHPIAVADTAIQSLPDSPGRFYETDLGGFNYRFVDTGIDVPRDQNLRLVDRIPDGVDEAVLWHPFQLWWFYRLFRLLKVPAMHDFIFQGRDQYLEVAGLAFSSSPASKFVDFLESDSHILSLRILALALEAEPLVHGSIYSSIRLDSEAGESLRGYFEWQAEQDGKLIMNQAGLSVDMCKSHYENMALDASLIDPIASFRPLIRHIDRDRRQRIRGDALLAHELYDHAEVLRRYLELHFDVALLEEDAVRYGPIASEVNKNWYGSERLADFDRNVLRRIARVYGIDPQARTTWFVEGDTEEGFLRSLTEFWNISLINFGLDIINLNGNTTVGNDLFRRVLEIMKRDELFAFVSIDLDNKPENVARLREYASQDLLCIGFTIWEPDFEAANFTMDELAQLCNTVLAKAGKADVVKRDDIMFTMNSITRNTPSVRTALEKTVQKRGAKLPTGIKWGRQLAEWANNNACPAPLADEEGLRPIVGILQRLLNNQRSDYALTMQKFKTDESGKMVPRQ